MRKMQIVFKNLFLIIGKNMKTYAQFKLVGLNKKFFLTVFNAF